jgi:hypothetical protein
MYRHNGRAVYESLHCEESDIPGLHIKSCVTTLKAGLERIRRQTGSGIFAFFFIFRSCWLNFLPQVNDDTICECNRLVSISSGSP